MNRRQLLASGGIFLSVAVPGCGSIRRRGVKYTLFMQATTSEEVVQQHGTRTMHLDATRRYSESTFREEAVYDFDDADLSQGERKILDSAIEDGRYTEGYVNWDDVPDRTIISEPFKSIILRLVDHVRSDSDESFGTPRVSNIRVETLSRYEGTIYETEVTSESAE